MATLTIPQRLPFLEAICWQMQNVHLLTPEEMLRRYERGWHYRSAWGDPSPQEQGFIDTLVQTYGSWLAGMATLGHHQKILQILSLLRADFFTGACAYFGGGTLLTLKYGEYRLSQDIDFLCSDRAGYRQLRTAIFDCGYAGLFESMQGIQLPREIQANQYGIRFPIVIDDTMIRFEIVSEGRIDLGEPDRYDWCPIACLSTVDSAAEKLLANSDRWLDKSVLSRDLIDLTVLRLQGDLASEAFAIAANAYPVETPLKQAVSQFQQDADYRDRCYHALSIQQPQQIVDGLDLLAADFGLPKTERSWVESRG